MKFEMLLKYILLCYFSFSVSMAQTDVCTDQQEYALTSSASSCQTCAGSMDTSLVHWFRFEDSDKPNFDSITGVVQGTISDLPGDKTVSGLLGNALNLIQTTGKNAKFVLESSVFVGVEWTLAFAFKLSASDDFGRFVVIDTFLEMSIKAGNNIRIFIYDDIGRQDVQDFCENTQAYNIQDDRFMFVALTTAYNAETQKYTLTAYCDGEKDDHVNNPMSINNARIGQTAIFGAPSESMGSDDGDVILDDLRIYNRVLSTTEIQILANQAAAANEEVTPCLDVCTDQQEYALTSSASSCQTCAGSMDTSLVHWFRFEDSDKPNFDSITGVEQGTLNEMPTEQTVAGALGSALNLVDSSSNNPTFVMDTAFFQQDYWTISFYFKVASNEKYGRFISFDNFLEMIMYNGNIRVFIYEDANSVRADIENFCKTSDPNYPYNLFMHATITGEIIPDSDTRKITIYCDGVKVQHSMNPWTIQNSHVSQQMTFGYASFYVFDKDNDVILDDLRMYNRVLSTTEIQILANQAAAANEEVTPCLCSGQLAASRPCNTCALPMTTAYSQYRLVSAEAGSTVSLAELEFYSTSSGENSLIMQEVP